MYWQKLTNGRLQQILPFRVFPTPHSTQKHAGIRTKDHLKYGLFMENYAKLHKNPITALIEERHLHSGKNTGVCIDKVQNKKLK